MNVHPPLRQAGQAPKVMGGGRATERVRAAEGMGISTDRDFENFPPAAAFPLCFPKGNMQNPKNPEEGITL